jgi:hypothetical protein
MIIGRVAFLLPMTKMCAVVALVLTSGCASEHPQMVAATQKTSAPGDDHITCLTELPTGTLIPTRVCKSKAAGDSGVQTIKDAVNQAKVAPHPGSSN